MKRFIGIFPLRILVLISTIILILPGRIVSANTLTETEQHGDATVSDDSSTGATEDVVEEDAVQPEDPVELSETKKKKKVSPSQPDDELAELADSKKEPSVDEEGLADDELAEDEEDYTTQILIGLGLAGAAGAAAVLIGSGGSSDQPAGDADIQNVPADNDTPHIVGPDLAGSNWSGYFKNSRGAYEAIIATITQNNSEIALVTSKSSGLGHSFHGKIYPNGDMLLYDDYDHEDWTTLYGPATSHSINIADYVFEDGHKIDTNKIVLKR